MSTASPNEISTADVDFTYKRGCQRRRKEHYLGKEKQSTLLFPLLCIFDEDDVLTVEICGNLKEDVS